MDSDLGSWNTADIHQGAFILARSVATVPTMVMSNDSLRGNANHERTASSSFSARMAELNGISTRIAFLRACLTSDPDAPIHDMLIDGGAGPVLIRRDIADVANLRLRSFVVRTGWRC